MRIPRVYVDLPLEPGTALELPSAQARHLTQVLRLPTETPLVLFNGDGYDYPAHLIRVERSGTAALIGTPGAPERVPPLNIHLALGVSKGERMDYALQKSVELGVGRVTPLFTERSQVHLSGPRLERRLEHWRGVLIGACEQSGRRRLPYLAAAATYSDWLSKHADGGLLLDPEADRPLTALSAPVATITLLIGPEGGLSPRERTGARTRGFEGVRLGPRILRTETAPLAAIAVIQALWGDLGD
ncbi:16S rRNA (uracil(1498)-N(3))-methyltransferase [Thiocapsa marina]|uniref:Ribosomal RNA small subunit methyltransferase E n=1 Tax=Thiocapsa marina 5811 TaxID=768671 RepID=F9UDS9_9GAMM|nr:16S rRNA (uracil(1498)-N(3))-methyltransferase [Thiocapsa marina]EGV17486.1 Ribosomal RNA small subunit methyltransferase E [Thiocapsa marina 5811]